MLEMIIYDHYCLIFDAQAVRPIDAPEGGIRPGPWWAKQDSNL